MTSLTAPEESPPAPSVPLLTAEEFLQRYPKHWVELERGVVTKLTRPGFEHGLICATITGLLGNHVVNHDLGWMVCNDTYLVTQRNPDTVRGMDFGYFSYERLPRGPIPSGLPPVPPELVVEVRSPVDTWIDMYTKVGEFLGAGVGVVVVVDPATRTASVYRQQTLAEIFRAGDTLIIADVLAGFSAPVSRLFE